MLLGALCALAGCGSLEPRRSLGHAEAALRQGRYSEAERRGQAALAAAERCGRPAAVAQAADFLAAIRMLQGRSPQAAALYRKALASFRSARDPQAAAATAFDLAGVLSLEGKNAEAEQFYETAVELSQKSGAKPEELYERLDGLAQFYEMQHRPEEAAIFAKRAAELSRKLERRSGR